MKPRSRYVEVPTSDTTGTQTRMTLYLPKTFEKKWFLGVNKHVSLKEPPPRMKLAAAGREAVRVPGSLCVIAIIVMETTSGAGLQLQRQRFQACNTDHIPSFFEP